MSKHKGTQAMKNIVNLITYITITMALIGATYLINYWFSLDLDPFDAIACAALGMAISIKGDK
jgi:hypothetical protein